MGFKFLQGGPCRSGRTGSFPRFAYSVCGWSTTQASSWRSGPHKSGSPCRWRYATPAPAAEHAFEPAKEKSYNGPSIAIRQGHQVGRHVEVIRDGSQSSSHVPSVLRRRTMHQTHGFADDVFVLRVPSLARITSHATPAAMASGVSVCSSFDGEGGVVFDAANSRRTTCSVQNIAVQFVTGIAPIDDGRGGPIAAWPAVAQVRNKRRVSKWHQWARL